jgi:hypothetical protein
MKLTDLEIALDAKGYDVLYVEVAKKQDRLYLDLEEKKNRKFNVYFADSQGSPFLYVFTNRPNEIKHNIEQTDDEKIQCIEAKFRILKLLKSDGIKGTEQYKTIDAVPLTPQPNKKKRIDL